MRNDIEMLYRLFQFYKKKAERLEKQLFKRNANGTFRKVQK
ncbi:hypothetical protein [Dyadobacter sp. CY327]|nr:hypothetical protein [Dyadobacter sp. CY327]